MECVHVLLGVDAEQDGLLIQMLGKRELAKYTVDLNICVQLVNKRVELVLRGVGGELV